MKKLLCLAAVMFILGTAAYSEAGYALFQQKKIELKAKLKTLELIREKEKNARRKNETGKKEDVKNGAAHKKLRRNYLNKRVNQQLDLFKRRIIDEYNIFQDIKLTKEEINNNRLNNKIYNLINKNLDNKKETTKEKKNKYDNVELVQRYTFKRKENRKKIRNKNKRRR